MSRICDLIAAKGPQSGHNVSHSNRRTIKKFRPNLQVFTLKSELLRREFRFRLATATIKTVDKHNGLDGFLTKVKTAKLTEMGKKLKKRVFALHKSASTANN